MSEPPSPNLQQRFSGDQQFNHSLGVLPPDFQPGVHPPHLHGQRACSDCSPEPRVLGNVCLIFRWMPRRHCCSEGLGFRSAFMLGFTEP